MDDNLTSSVLTRVDPALMRYALALRDRVLLALGDESGSGRAVTVTSCHRGEGVTTIAASLAAAFGAAGSWQVLLCDANVDAPGLGRLFGLGDTPGLAEALDGQELDRVVQNTGLPSVKILTAGQRRITPSEMVESLRAGGLMAALRERYAFTIFDAPPVVDCNATAMLAALTDGSILVIEAEREQYEVARTATQLLKNAQSEVLGAVLNKRQFHIPGFLYRRL